MRASATAKNIEVHIEAHGVEAIQEYLEEYDLFLLGPQIRFKKDELQKLADPLNKRVEVIDMMDYGMLKGEKILDDALRML